MAQGVKVLAVKPQHPPPLQILENSLLELLKSTQNYVYT